jgi:DNA-binding PadR family transcriptional regulator
MDTTSVGAWPPFGRDARERGARHHHHRRRMGPPWFGGPPGWGFPGGPGGGRQRQRRGDVRLAVLTLLAEAPMHGYQIITELTERSGGAWRPSPGSVYPTLQQLEDEGLVTVAELDGRRTYTLTDGGREELERGGQDRRPPWEQVGDDDEPSGRLRQRAGEVMAAVMQVAMAGTPEQAGRAERVLVETRRKLYQLLAEGDEGEQS